MQGEIASLFDASRYQFYSNCRRLADMSVRNGLLKSGWCFDRGKVKLHCLSAMATVVKS